MPFPAFEIKKLLKQEFSDGIVEVTDTMGNQDYYDIRIASKRFQDLNKLQQHKMVYQLLGDIVGEKVHAVTLNTEIME